MGNLVLAGFSFCPTLAQFSTLSFGSLAWTLACSLAGIRTGTANLRTE